MKSPSVAVGNDELICAKCRTEVVPTIPKPKSRVKKKPPSTAPRQKTVPLNSRSRSAQSKASAEAVVKAWTDSNKIWRVDEAHLTSKSEVEPTQVKQETAQETTTVLPSPVRKTIGYHLILFGVFVFLIGHALTIWAFLAGHFGAWTIGSFCSVGGITIAVVSVVQALKDLESRLANTTKTVNGATKTVRRIKRKKVRSKSPTH